MVQGKWEGSLKTAELDCTKSCGTFCSFRYRRIARFPSVPKVLKTKRTLSFSTSLRARSMELGASGELWTLTKLTLRPLTPPRSLIIRKYEASARATAAYSLSDGEEGAMLPIFISVSEAPGS